MKILISSINFFIDLSKPQDGLEIWKNTLLEALETIKLFTEGQKN